jgi:hypothetical protein
MNYTKWTKNIANGHKIYQHFPFQGPPKFTQIWFFGLKTNHLATLLKALAFFFDRRCCEQHGGAPGAGGVPAGRPDQEDQGRTAGKYVSAAERGVLVDAEKDHRQPPAKEKEVLAHLVVDPS